MGEADVVYKGQIKNVSKGRGADNSLGHEIHGWVDLIGYVGYILCRYFYVYDYVCVCISMYVRIYVIIYIYDATNALWFILI